MQDIRKALSLRHHDKDRICISAAKPGSPRLFVEETFVNGIDAAVAVVERNMRDSTTLAVWSNLQMLKPDAERRVRENIVKYTNITIDLDRRIKTDATGQKVNATDAEKEVLKDAGKKVITLLEPTFGQAIITDSGNGYHLTWATVPLEPAEGKRIYGDLLAILRAKIESPEVNMEIDLSLADETQVVTVPWTWNRKYPEFEGRPQRQSKILSSPSRMVPVGFGALELFIALNETNVPEKKAAHQPFGLGDGPLLHPNFDEEKWWKHYEPIFICVGERDGWQVLSVCPLTFTGKGKGTEYRHTGSICTGVRFDRGKAEFHCFSSGDEAFPDHDSVSFGQMKKHLDQYYPKYPGKIWEFPKDKKFDDFDLNVDVVEAEAEDEKDMDNPQPRSARPGESTRVGTDGTIYVYTDNGGTEQVRIPEPTPEPESKADNIRSAPSPNPKAFEIVRTKLKGGRVAGLTAVRASDVRERPVEWLWKGRLPVRSGLVISGPPGSNKSSVVDDLIARVTTGRDWPDGVKNTLGPREVYLAFTEDDAETTVKPRLMVAGADCSKVYFHENYFECGDDGNKQTRSLNLDEDTKRLYEMLLDHPEILLVVLDPLTGFYGDIDGNDNRKIRPMMERIAKVCRLTGAAFIMIIHENKKSEAAAVDRILGAGAVSQVIRAGLRFSKDPKNKPDGRIMANIKSNLSKAGGGMRFTVGSKNITAYDGRELEDILYISWGDAHDMSADDVMDEERAHKKEAANGDGEDSKVGTAMQIFSEALKNGKRLQRDVHALLDAANISEMTKRRARRQLGVVSSKSAPWHWWLPETVVEETEAEPKGKMGDVEVM